MTGPVSVTESKRVMVKEFTGPSSAKENEGHWPTVPVNRDCSVFGKESVTGAKQCP